MGLPKFDEVVQLEIEEIRKEILTVKRQLFDLKVKKSTRQSIKPHLFKHAHHRLAQLLMAEQKLLSSNK